MHGSENAAKNDPGKVVKKEDPLKERLEVYAELFIGLDDKFGKYYCKAPECDYMTKDLYGMKRHIQTHFPEKLIKCYICSEMFQTQKSMQKHKKIRHIQKRTPSYEEKEMTAPEGRFRGTTSNGVNAKSWLCLDCQEHFTCKRRFFLHLRNFQHMLSGIRECHFCNEFCLNSKGLVNHIKLYCTKNTGSKWFLAL